MFTKSPKLFVLWALGAALIVTIAFEVSRAASPEEELHTLATKLVAKAKDLATKEKSRDAAKQDVLDREARLAVAQASLEAAEKDAQTELLRLKLAEQANDQKALAAAIKSAEAAALKALQARVARDEAQQAVDVAKTQHQGLETDVKKAEGEVKAAEGVLKKTTAKFLQSKKTSDAIVKAAKNAETAAKKSEKVAESAEKAAKNAETAAKKAQTAAECTQIEFESVKAAVENVQKTIDNAAQSADPIKCAISAVNKVIKIVAQTVMEASETRERGPSEDWERGPSRLPGKRAEPPAKSVCCTAAINPAPASKTLDPFRRHPFMAPVKKASDMTDFCKPLPNEDDCVVSKQYTYDYRFDAAAHFPLPGFGLSGEATEGEGAIIYEGMRFAITEDGRYQVRFVVGTPAMPVTMRLQLILEDEGTRNRYTLTLPPISIPEADEPANTFQKQDVDPLYARLQTVHHEGYLPALDTRSQYIRVVRRTGSARFGFGVKVP